MKAKKRKVFKLFKSSLAVAVCAAICLPVMACTTTDDPDDDNTVDGTSYLEDGTYSGTKTTSGYLSENGKYYSDFNDIDEAHKVGKDINVQLAEEGDVLLKNENNALPLDKYENRVTLFGVKSIDIQTGGGGSGSGYAGTYGIETTTLQKSMEDAGFIVNQKVLDLYEANIDSLSYTVESAGSAQTLTTELPLSYYNSTITKSYRSYNDAAIITFSRTGAEGVDLVMHDVPGHSDTTEHILELSDAERDLVKHAKENFSKVIVIINSSNIMEVGELNEPKTSDNLGVDAILWVGHVGNDGAAAIGKILNGTVNPSGHTVDLWSADFKNDPSWTNFGDGAQVGEDNYVYLSNGTDTGFRSVEYREDIYNGYRYYETIAADMNAATEGSGDDWYSENVVYPFGYGLSYTTFDWEIESSINPSAEIRSADSTITMKVKVTNTGDVAGKDVVQLYVSTPYTQGSIEKASTVLMGYEKTQILDPGESEVVTIQFTAQDMASFDWDDANNNGFVGYELEAGKYTVSVCRNSHEVVDTVTRTISEDILCATDIDTGNEITAVFSQTEGALADYNSTNDALVNNLISRANGLSQPTASTKSDRTVSQAWYDKVEGLKNYTLDMDDEDDPWYVTSVPSNWTQASSHEADYSDVVNKISSVSGVDYTNYKVSNGTVIQGTDAGTNQWVEFLNQLTWEELCQLASQGSYGRPAVESIDMPFQPDVDGPAQVNWYGNIQQQSYYPNQNSDEYSNSEIGTLWVTAVVIASTWNDELAEEMGVQVGNESILSGAVGWYGPSLNTHRNALGGRNFEYYSEDPVISGTMAAAVVSGATSKGVVCYAKHMFLNEQETNRDTKRGLCTYATEQAIREIYLKPFEYVIKSGHTLGTMSASNRIGSAVCYGNYALHTAILRGEWDYKGMSITDSCAGNNLAYSSLNHLVRNGVDCPLGVGTPIEGHSKYGADDCEYYLDQGEWNADENMVYVDGVASPTQYYTVRVAAMHVLYATANSFGIKNGVNASTQYITLEGGVDISQSIIDPDAINATSFANVTAEGLPDGLSISSDGTLSGTPTKAGTYTVSLSFDADGWISKTMEVVITVTERIEYSGSLSVSAGDDISVTFSSDVYPIGMSLDGYMYGYAVTGSVSVNEFSASGLPEGLTLSSDGVLTGTIAEAGTYTFEVTITGSGYVSLYGRMFPQSRTFTQTFTVIVS